MVPQNPPRMGRRSFASSHDDGYLCRTCGTLSPGLLDNHLWHRIVAGVLSYDAPPADRDSGSQYGVVGIDAVGRVPLPIELASRINHTLIDWVGFEQAQEIEGIALFFRAHEKDNLGALHGPDPQLNVFVNETLEKASCLIFAAEMPDEDVTVDKYFHCEDSLWRSKLRLKASRARDQVS